MEETRKILIIDKSLERKTRIQALKSLGFAVYPALKIAEAGNRCKPGSYDLIVVNAGDEQDAALELCDTIRQRAPKQLLLLMVAPGSAAPNRDYVMSNKAEELASRAESLLRRRSVTADSGVAA
jgi:DNA-binding response OmpR family regulator